MTRDTRLPPNYRWNFLAFAVDYVFFSLALAFVRPDSVLPAFVRQFTRSAPVIGLVSTMWSACWLLPQVVAAGWINDKPRKKPYLILGISGRLPFWILVLALWLGLARYPVLTLVLFFICLALFAVPDGLASLAWFDILARAIPLKRRGRLIGTSQVLGGLAGLGAGAVIGRILESTRFPFPTNYTLIFTLASAAFIPSAIALTLLREPQPSVAREERKPRSRNTWLQPWLDDATFRRLLVSRVLVGMSGMATPFYVIHATDVLNLPEAIVGSFVMAQQLAGVAAGMLLGMVSDRWGPRPNICIGGAFAAAGPLFALAAHVTDGGLFVRAYPLVYVAFGFYLGSQMPGFYNYLMEIAPDDMRPSYIGLGNTIAGVLALAPTVGGWLLQTTSYITLFGITAGFVSLGTILALRLEPAMGSAPGESR